jgi:hypothetical protein
MTPQHHMFLDTEAEPREAAPLQRERIAWLRRCGA